MLHCQVSLPVYKDTHGDTNTDIELYKHMFWVDRLYVYIYILDGGLEHVFHSIWDNPSH
jgi:hypothetical protein